MIGIDMNNLIKDLISNLINPKVKEKRQFDLKQEYQLKFNKSLYLKEYLKTKAWQEFNRPIIYNSLEAGIGKLLRDGLTMNETEIKAIIADMRANLNHIIEMRYAVESGEEAGIKLEAMK